MIIKSAARRHCCQVDKLWVDNRPAGLPPLLCDRHDGLASSRPHDDVAVTMSDALDGPAEQLRQGLPAGAVGVDVSL